MANVNNMTMKEYMARTRTEHGAGVERPRIEDDTPFEIKGQIHKELRDITFSGTDGGDANEHIEKVMEIFDMFHLSKMTQDKIMLRIFLKTLVGAAKRWITSEPMATITIWDIMKNKFLAKYCP
nr:hypothetical protein [Tanacetum cinerariifolium]